MRAARSIEQLGKILLVREARCSQAESEMSRARHERDRRERERAASAKALASAAEGGAHSMARDPSDLAMRQAWADAIATTAGEFHTSERSLEHAGAALKDREAFWSHARTCADVAESMLTDAQADLRKLREEAELATLADRVHQAGVR